MLARLQLSQMLPSKYTLLTKHQALASTDVKGQISNMSQFSFLGKGQNGRQNKVSLSRLFIQAPDVLKLASNSQNRIANTLVREIGMKKSACPSPQIHTKPVSISYRYLSALPRGLFFGRTEEKLVKLPEDPSIHLHLLPKK